jgi:hypothetical protein
MHPWLEQHVYKHIEFLKLKAGLLGMTVETYGHSTNVFFVIPATIRTMTFDSGQEPSEQQLDATFDRACRALDCLRAQAHREFTPP